MFHDRSSSSCRVLSIVSRRSWGGVSTLLLFLFLLLLLLSSWDAIKMWTKSVWIPGVKEEQEQEKEDPFHQLEKGEEEGNKKQFETEERTPLLVIVCVSSFIFVFLEAEMRNRRCRIWISLANQIPKYTAKCARTQTKEVASSSRRI